MAGPTPKKNYRKIMEMNPETPFGAIFWQILPDFGGGARGFSILWACRGENGAEPVEGR